MGRVRQRLTHLQSRRQKLNERCQCGSASIEWFIEDQAFPCMIWPLQQVVSLSQSSCVSPVELMTREGGIGGPKSIDGEKAWSCINSLILSDRDGLKHFFILNLFFPLGGGRSHKKWKNLQLQRTDR
jgi:hypothetical protein